MFYNITCFPVPNEFAKRVRWQKIRVKIMMDGVWKKKYKNPGDLASVLAKMWKPFMTQYLQLYMQYNPNASKEDATASGMYFYTRCVTY